jgi:hypothetical protein
MRKRSGSPQKRSRSIRARRHAAEAIRLANGHDIELWQLGRLVETFRHPPEESL